MRILGIETSCDETGVAIYDEDKGLIANQLYTQIALHADYGGVVPELACQSAVHTNSLACGLWRCGARTGFSRSHSQNGTIN